MAWQTQSALPSVCEGKPPISGWIDKQSSQWIETPQCVMTSSNGNIFRLTGHLWEETTDHRWISLTKASDAELWYFLWSTPGQTAEQTLDTPVIWDTHGAHYEVIVMAHDHVTSLWTYIGKTSLYYILTQDNVSLDHEILFAVRLESHWFDASTWWRHQMETFSALLALFGESTGRRWIPRAKASDSELSCFQWSPSV